MLDPVLTSPVKAPPLRSSAVKLRTYTGESLEVEGKLMTTVEYQGQVERLPLLVVQARAPVF